MSNWTVVRYSIQNVNREIVKQVVKKLAEMLNGTYVENVEIYGFGARKYAEFAILKHGTYGNGIGFNVTEEGVEIFGDTHGMGISISKVKEMFNQMYVTEVVKETLTELGIPFEVTEEQGNYVINAYVS